MSSYWKTKDGEEILISNMTTSHLENSIKYVERVAKNGLQLFIRMESDTDSYYTWLEPSEILFGEDVLNRFNYKELCEEMNKRKPTPTVRENRTTENKVSPNMNDEMKKKFQKRFYSWIYDDDKRNSNEDIDAPEMEKDIYNFITEIVEGELHGFADYLINKKATKDSLGSNQRFTGNPTYSVGVIAIIDSIKQYLLERKK